MRIAIAALFSAALIWLVPNAHAQTLNNSEAKVAVTKPVGKVHQVVTAPAQVVKRVETPAPTTPAPQPEPVAPVVPPPPPPPTTHEELMAAAGILPADYGAVDYIVSHESGWNQDATEPVSGAHGLVQALPFSKTGCGWEDAVCTLRWGQQYAISRYGGWWAAQAYWSAHRNW